MSISASDDYFYWNNYYKEANQLRNEKEELLTWLDREINDNEEEANYSGSFSSSYWEGKADALKEVKTKLTEQKP